MVNYRNYGFKQSHLLTLSVQFEISLLFNFLVTSIIVLSIKQVKVINNDIRS